MPAASASGSDGAASLAKRRKTPTIFFLKPQQMVGYVDGPIITGKQAKSLQACMRNVGLGSEANVWKSNAATVDGALQSIKALSNLKPPVDIEEEERRVVAVITCAKEATKAMSNWNRMMSSTKVLNALCEQKVCSKHVSAFLQMMFRTAADTLDRDHEQIGKRTRV